MFGENDMLKISTDYTEEVHFKANKVSAKNIKPIAVFSAAISFIFATIGIILYFVSETDKFDYLGVSVILFVCSLAFLVCYFSICDSVLKKRLAKVLAQKPEYLRVVDYLFEEEHIQAFDNATNEQNQYKYSDIKKVYKEADYLYLKFSLKKMIVLPVHDDETTAQLRMLLINKGVIKI